MSIASYITLQTSIGHLLSLLRKPQIKVPHTLKNAINFLYKEDDGSLTALDIRSKVPANMLSLMAKGFEGVNKIARFVMVTPYAPEPAECKAFDAAFKGVFQEARWMSVNEFAASLGLKQDWDLTSPTFVERLKAASVSEQVFGEPEPPDNGVDNGGGNGEDNGGENGGAQKGVQKGQAEAAGAPPAKGARPKAKPGGAGKAASSKVQAERINKLLESFDRGETEIPHAYVNLTRKMPYQTLRALKDSEQQPEEFFRIGDSSRDAIIVLSDIVNFSLLVRTAYPEDLNQAMYRYYRGAQSLIYEHGGILDKFNGDSVLAVFNYPSTDDVNCGLALKFAANLVQLGKDILAELTASIDEKIPTGTRVGISMGEMWTLNIGTDEIDVTFVGDKINLAKRLESNCDIDGVLLSNVFYKSLARTDQALHAKLRAEKRDLPEDKVKGQTTDIISWQVSPGVLPELV